MKKERNGSCQKNENESHFLVANVSSTLCLCCQLLRLGAVRKAVVKTFVWNWNSNFGDFQILVVVQIN